MPDIFFIRLKGRSMLCLVFQEHEKVVFSSDKVLANKYYPEQSAGVEIFVKPEGYRPFRCVKNTDILLLPENDAKGNTGLLPIRLSGSSGNLLIVCN
jgi:tetraacyldisaccharide-1-P 4'-kinase